MLLTTPAAKPHAAACSSPTARNASHVNTPTTMLVTMRTNYSFTTNMFLDALIQYNRDRRQINTNIRFNFIHRPLSDLYVVYNEQRFTTDGAPPGRGVIVKFSQMFPF